MLSDSTHVVLSLLLMSRRIVSSHQEKRFNKSNVQGELAESEEQLRAARELYLAQKAALDEEMQSCRALQQENEASAQRLAQESQEWSAGEIRRQEVARRAATAEAELELIDVSGHPSVLATSKPLWVLGLYCKVSTV